jgi:hypothetical protein
MQQARRSELLRPSGRLLESRSDPGPRGMIIVPRRRKSRRKSGPDSAATESGLQTHPRLTFVFSLHLSPQLGLVCKNCAVKRWFFHSVRARHDLSGALAEFFYVGRIVLFDHCDGS